MNARDIIKLAAQLYVDDYLKKKTTILANAEKGKDINIDIFMPKVTEVTISDFAKYLQKAIESQPEEERAKHRKFFGEPISFCTSVLVEEFNSEVKKIKKITRYKENVCFRSRVYATQKAIKQNYKNTRT